MVDAKGKESHEGLLGTDQSTSENCLSVLGEYTQDLESDRCFRGVCMSPPWFGIWGRILFRQLGAMTGLAESDLGHGK